jgi:hypothetical protein
MPAWTSPSACRGGRGVAEMWYERHCARLMAVLVVLAFSSACARASQDQPGSSAQDWQTEGEIQVMDGQIWVVGAHLVTVPPQASITGKPAVGVAVRLSGKRTAAGELRADRVQVVDSPAEATPRPTSAAAPAATPAPVPQPTARPADIRSPVAPAAPARPAEQRRGNEDKKGHG